MKKIIFQDVVFVSGLIFACSVNAQARVDLTDYTAPPRKQMEVRAKLHYIYPNDDDTWRKAAGGDVQCIFWTMPNFGIAVEVGYHSWEAMPDSVVTATVKGKNFYGRVEGDTDTFSTGVSTIYKIVVADEFNLLLEGGFRYLMHSSDITYSEDVPLFISGNTIVYDTYKAAIDIDNGLVAFLAAECQYEFRNGWSIFGGGGYQFDILKGKVETLGQKGDKIEFAGFYINGGISFAF